MFALFLMATSQFFAEASATMGKGAVKRRYESIYSFAFLNIFWSLIFILLAVIIFKTPFKFSAASLPYFIPRVGLELLLEWLAVKAIVKADRSTFGFIRTITIPLILMSDIIMGYKISPLEILGIMLIFVTLVVMLGQRTINRRGSGLTLLFAMIAPFTLTIYKYDITHFNSVAGEQTMIFLADLAFFTGAAWMHKREKTWEYLLKPFAEFQSVLMGLGSALDAYTYAYVPASVALTMKRSTAVLWSIIFGNVYFHERKLKQKLAGFSIVSIAVVLVALGAR